MRTTTRISLALALASSLVLTTPAESQKARAELSAWQALIEANPAAAEDPTIGPLERKILLSLSPTQAERWLEGANPATLLLEDGTPLSSFIRKTVESASDGPGLAFFPLPACTFASTSFEQGRSAVQPLRSVEQRDYRLRGALRDLSSQGGSASGCGVPESAEAVFVKVRAINAEARGTLSVHQAGQPSLDSGFIHLGEPGARESAVITSELCHGECPDGDLTVSFRPAAGASDTAATHLELDVLGYFEPFQPDQSFPSPRPANVPSDLIPEQIVAQSSPIGRPKAPLGVSPEAITGGSDAGLVGEIKIFAGNFEPDGWLFADGRLLAIRNHLALFEVVGNTYGGDGLTTFGIPDLRGRLPMGQGAGAGLTNRNLGQEPGAESVILDVTQLPSHDHSLRATNSAASQTQAAGNILATAGTAQYLNASTSVVMGSSSIGSSGSNVPHANIQPSTVLSFLVRRGPAENILLKGLFGPIPGGDLACAPSPAQDRIIVGRRSGAVRLDRHSGLQFTSGGVDYLGLIQLEHEDGVGTIWYAIPKNHDLETGPVTVQVVLAPDVVTPVVRTPGDSSSACAAPLPTREELLATGFYTEVSSPTAESKNGTTEAPAENQRIQVSSGATKFDRHSGLQFTSGGVVYLGIRILEIEDGIGAIWLAIPKNHDLDTGPLDVLIVLAPDVVTPVVRTGPGATVAALYESKQTSGRAVEDAGLLYRPVPACTFASTAKDSRLADTSELERRRGLKLRGPTRDLSDQGGSRTGCGVPDEARAILVALRSHDSSGSGAISLHRPGAEPATGLLTFDPFGARSSTAAVELCQVDCSDEDLVLELLARNDLPESSGLSGATGVTLDVLGYFATRSATTEGARSARERGRAAGFAAGAQVEGSVATRREPALVDNHASLGEIRLFSGNFEPGGWRFADGRLLAIRDHAELFQILGNAYGGNGLTTLGLPDLRGRVPMGQGAGPGLTNRNLGEEPGAETVILDVNQLASHDHTLRATNSSATQTQPAGNVLATAATAQYLDAATTVVMGSGSIGATGSNAPHANVAPSSVLSFLVATAPTALGLSSNPRRVATKAGSLGEEEGQAVRVESAATRLDRHSGLEFTSGGVDYLGIQLLEHEDGVGTIWLAIPKNHDLDTGPVNVKIVLAPDVVTPV